MKEQETYQQAIERLQKIVGQIDSGELDIDQLTDKIKEAKEIINFCTDKLTNVGKEVEILLADKQ